MVVIIWKNWFTCTGRRKVEAWQNSVSFTFLFFHSLLPDCHRYLLQEETLQRCKEDEEKRTEITTHFQSMLGEIQSQIELHSTRNEKLCRENVNLTDKLENLMTQCERREEVRGHRSTLHIKMYFQISLNKKQNFRVTSDEFFLFDSLVNWSIDPPIHSL